MTNFTLMDEFMDFATQTDEWFRICKKDPRLKEAKRKKDNVLDQVKQSISRELYIKLEDSIMEMQAAWVDIAMIYGMKLFYLIGDTINQQTEYSRYILDGSLA